MLRSLIGWLRLSSAVALGLFVALMGFSAAADFRLRRPAPGISSIAQAAAGLLKDLTDVSDSLAPSEGQVLKYSGGQWTAAADADSGGPAAIFTKCTDASSATACVGARANGGQGDGTYRFVNCDYFGNIATGVYYRYSGGKWQWFWPGDAWYDCTDGSALIAKIN